jgi:hypothetical protein
MGMDIRESEVKIGSARRVFMCAGRKTYGGQKYER